MLFEPYYVDQMQACQHDLEEAKRIFDKFDKDNNGYITKKELKKAMRNLGQKMSAEEVHKMLADMDTDKNGTIDFEEFCKFIFNDK